MNHTRPTITEEPLPATGRCKECGCTIGNTLRDRPDKGMCARCWSEGHD